MSPLSEANGFSCTLTCFHPTCDTWICLFCLVCVVKRISHHDQQELSRSFLVHITAFRIMSSSSVTTFPQKTRAAASMSSPNIVNLLGFPTRTYPVEPHGASTEIRSEKWSTVDLDYCTTSKWKSLINSSSGRHQYIRFVRCMVRRISFNASNDAEIQAFSELILSDENEEFLWVAMPELPDCEQLP